MDIVYILLLNNGEHYSDFSEWVNGVFTDKKEAVAFGKVKTRSDFFNIEEWEIGGEKYKKCYTYEFSNVTKKWTHN